MVKSLVSLDCYLSEDLAKVGDDDIHDVALCFLDWIISAIMQGAPSAYMRQQFVPMTCHRHMYAALVLCTIELPT